MKRWSIFLVAMVALSGGTEGVLAGSEWCTRPSCVVISRDCGERTARARVRMDPKWVRPRRYPEIIVKNTGQTTIGFGYPYRIQRYENGRWNRVRSYEAYPAVLLLMKPGERFSQRVSVRNRDGDREPWKTGRYRILKDVELCSRSVDAKVVFRVFR